MWSAPGMNNPPKGMNAKNAQLCPPHLSFGSGMSTARHHDSDGEQMRDDEEDPELARKRKQLQEIEERILLKKALISQKHGNMFQDDAASCEVRDKRVAHNTPDTSGIHAFSKLSNEDGGRAFFCHKGASLRDRVNTVLQQKHTADYFTKLQLKKAKETQNSLSQRKDGFMKLNHPLRRRVCELMRQMLSCAREIPANREVAGITQSPPSQSLHPAVKQSIINNKGFQRFLTVLNQGVDINLLSKIVNNETQDLPLKDGQSPAVEKKSNLSYRTGWRDKPPSPHGTQWQDHRQTNSVDSKTEPASREQTNWKRISNADEKKDKEVHLGSSQSTTEEVSKLDEKKDREGHLGSSPTTTGGVSKLDEKNDREGHLGSLPFNRNGLSKEDEMKDTRGHLVSLIFNKNGLSKEAEMKDTSGHLGSRPFSKNRLCEADAKNDKEGQMGVAPSNNKGISKVSVENEREGHFHSSSQSQLSPSSNKGISEADEKKWSDKLPSDIGEQWQDHRHTKSAERETELVSKEQSNKKGLSKADEKKERRSRFSPCSPSQSSLSNNKGTSSMDENKDTKGSSGSSRQSPSSHKQISKAEEKDRRDSLSCSSPPQSLLYKNKGILKKDEKKRKDNGSRSRSPSSTTMDHLEKVDSHEEQLQKILKTLGVNLDPEDMSRLSDRTRERLYGKKTDDRRLDNSRQEQEFKQRSSKRRRSSSSSSSNSDIYRNLISASSDSEEQAQSSDSRKSRNTPTFEERKKVKQDILKDQDRVGFKEIPSHHPYTESQIYSIPLPHMLTNYGMPHYAQHPYLGVAYNSNLNLGYTPDALSSWYYLNRYHYLQNPNALSFAASSAGSNFGLSPMVNPDLSMCEGQSGMFSGARYIQAVNTQNDLTKEQWILTRYNVDSQDGKQIEKEKERPENTDKMVLVSPMLKVKEQPRRSQHEDKWQPTDHQQQDKRQRSGHQKRDKWQPTGHQRPATRPPQEDKRQPTRPPQEDKRQPIQPPQENKHTIDQKKLKEEEIRATLKRKLDIFNQMAKERCMPARNSLT